MKHTMKSKTKLFLRGVLLVLFAGLFGLYVYLRSAEVLSPSQIDWLTSTLIAHRGVHDNENGTPENTLAAFKSAIDHGLIIELDVQSTKDDRIVVVHDDDLERLLGLAGKVKEYTYDEIIQRKILNSDQTIPLLSDVLDLIDGKVPVLIEIKNDQEVGEFESRVAQILEDYEGRFAVIAFNPYTLRWFRDNAPDIVRGQISGHYKVSEEDKLKGKKPRVWYERFMLSNLLVNFESRPNFIVYEIKDTSVARIRWFKELNVPLLGYTIDNQEEYDQVKGYYDNLIVNTVDLD
ncbi:MAG TPA: glycerophosphodiester phosphodiesterase [Erysipelotrichaceae bacterium]|nr:glycerophosphodiester phosphodiesterase [Erysipelotrichaceae bacterium]HAO62348.1 glycerophosphodiester phosphodiesterase [Erysipelotrichaceae bacterium]HBZ40939.1 glycerophosphodiester phosphodiesterase [Erysipelotrichaceae bacterium]